MSAVVRRESFAVHALRRPQRILYASDLHLGLPWTKATPSTLLRTVAQAAPDLVLLGGDIIDNRRGLDQARDLVAALGRLAPVLAVAGNHDARFGVEELRRRVLAGSGHWLHDRPFVLAPRDDEAPIQVAAGATESPSETFALRIACLHDPAESAAVARRGYGLAFAGHLHGGQCVLFEHRGRFYPGALFNRWTGPTFQVAAMRLFVSRGLGDTLPLRWNCPREVIVCDLAPTTRAFAN